MPRARFASISLGVATPGIIGIPSCRARSTTAGFVPGDTRNWAPAAIAARPWATLRTVPAPTSSEGTSVRRRSIAWGAPRGAEGDLDAGQSRLHEGRPQLGGDGGNRRPDDGNDPP